MDAKANGTEADFLLFVHFFSCSSSPITCAFASVDDFDYNYRGGIYVDRTNATDSDHDVEVVGWGVDEETGMKYWKARNSWGTYCQ